MPDTLNSNVLKGTLFLWIPGIMTTIIGGVLLAMLIGQASRISRLEVADAGQIPIIESLKNQQLYTAQTQMERTTKFGEINAKLVELNLQIKYLEARLATVEKQTSENRADIKKTQ